jgi:two-component sensor histidine kinase
VQRTFGHDIGVRVSEDADPWQMPEAESIPVALTLNELLTNAIKHGGSGGVHCEVALEDSVEGEQIAITISNRGRLPPGFELARFRGAISGLGLARALLPRRSATLTLAQQGEEVVARVQLRAPSVVRDAAAAPALLAPQ